MSWLGYKATNTKSESEIREEKRKKLEQERLFRSKQREAHRKQLQAAIDSRREADEVLQNLLDIRGRQIF